MMDTSRASLEYDDSGKYQNGNLSRNCDLFTSESDDQDPKEQHKEQVCFLFICSFFTCCFMIILCNNALHLFILAQAH